MSVELVSSAFVHRLVTRIATARTEALAGFERMPAPGAPDEARYWEGVLEANAALVLRCLDTTRLAPGFAVRYCFYDNRGGELRIRPFVARESTDVSGVKRVLDWHPAPDAQRRSGLLSHDQDASILYRHFSFPRSAEGVFEYWFAMQEIWASSQLGARPRRLRRRRARPAFVARRMAYRARRRSMCSRRGRRRSRRQPPGRAGVFADRARVGDSRADRDPGRSDHPLRRSPWS